MTTHYWQGGADAVAQVTTATPGGSIGTNTFTLTVGGTAISYTATSGNTATEVAEGLRDAWNGSTHPYFAAVTAAASSGVVTLTADIAGVPFVVSGSATGAGSLSMATPTASAGPNDWSTAGNWSTGSVPTTGDIVHLNNNAAALLWGLNQSAVTLSALHIAHTFTGVVGLPLDRFTVDPDSSDSSKPEYRTSYLRVGATQVNIGAQADQEGATGASRLKLDTGSGQTQLNVLASSSSSADAGLPALRWKGTHAGNVVNVTRGQIALAGDTPGETATLSELNVGQQGDVANDALVTVGSGVTVTTVRQAGGVLYQLAGATTLWQSAGTCHVIGSGALTTARIAGIAYLGSTGAIGTLTVVGGGQADFSRDPRARTVTNCALHRGATLNLDNGFPLSITLTNGIELQQCQLTDVTLHTGSHVKLSLASI